MLAFLYPSSRFTSIFSSFSSSSLFFLTYLFPKLLCSSSTSPSIPVSPSVCGYIANEHPKHPSHGTNTEGTIHLQACSYDSCHTCRTLLYRFRTVEYRFHESSQPKWVHFADFLSRGQQWHMTPLRRLLRVPIFTPFFRFTLLFRNHWTVEL